MKRIFVFLAIVGFSMMANAQPYRPILSDSIHWYGNYFTFGYYASTDYNVYGDTLIDGKHYQWMDKFHFNKQVFLREDTANKKLYYRQPFDFRANEDILLYDFALNVGDSMLLFNPNSEYPDSVGYFTLDSIGQTTLEPGLITRTFYLRNRQTNANTIWIEGVGSLGLINAPGALPDSNNLNITCLYKEDEHYYWSTLGQESSTCEISTLGIQEKEDVRLSIFPNPSDGKFTIDLPRRINNLQLTIRTIDGQVLLSKQMINKIRVDIHLVQSPGLYLLEFRGDNFYEIQKILLN